MTWTTTTTRTSLRRWSLPSSCTLPLLLLLASSIQAFLLLPTPSRLGTGCCTATRHISSSSIPLLHTRRRRGSSSSSLSVLFASTNNNKDQEEEEEEEEVEPRGELAKLLATDPKEGSLLGYLAFVTVSLLALGIGTYKSGGPLLGLGFSSDENFYWDSAPSYALLLVYPPLFFVFPEARSLLLKTVVGSFIVTLGIWAFPYEAIGWEPTNDHVLVTAAVPILAYFSFFSWRATKAYLEIAQEEKEEEEAR